MASTILPPLRVLTASRAVLDDANRVELGRHADPARAPRAHHGPVAGGGALDARAAARDAPVRRPADPDEHRSGPVGLEREARRADLPDPGAAAGPRQRPCALDL